MSPCFRTLLGGLPPMYDEPLVVRGVFELGPLLPVEEHLFTTCSVRVVRGDYLAFMPLRRILQQSWVGMGWLLLDHLGKHPLFFGDRSGPILSLRFVDVWTWASRGEGAPVYLDVDRTRKHMQLLGMLEHSWREEWERSVTPG